METWRRVSLLLGASLAVWLFYSVSLAPVVTVELADFARMQRNETGYSEEGRCLRQLPLSESVEETSRDRKIPVSGETWVAFFRTILAASGGRAVGSDWHQRVSRDQRRWQSLPYRLFFRPWEQPLAQVAERVAAHGAEGCFLCLEHEGQDQYLALRYQAYSNADFQLGSGLVAYPSPPWGFLYPYRSAAPRVFVAGVAAYFLIPWKKREPEAICYPYPLAAIVTTALCWYLGNTMGTAARFSSAESRPDPHSTAIPGKLAATGLVWEKTIGLQEATVGQSLIETPDGDLLVCALTWQPGGAVQLVATVGTDRDGEVIWSKTYGDTRINHVGSVVPASDHGYFLVGLVADRVDLFAKQQMCIRKLSATGDLQWERLWSANKKDSPTACDAAPLEDGGAVIWGCSERKIHRLQLDAAGAAASARTYDLRTQVADARLHWVGAMTDGGCIATGQILNPGAGFIDLLLVRFTPSGQVAWHRAFGGKRKESGVYVRQAASGGFVAAGVTHSGESRDQDVYVVLADGDGTLRWEKPVVKPGSQSARRVSLTPEGGFLVVGESQPTNDARPLLFLVELQADGTLIGQQQIGRENMNYSGADAMVASDGSRLLLGTRSLREFSDEVVLVKLSAQ